MKYYVVADPHGFFEQMIGALTEKGFFADTEPHKLIVCGDLLDRGKQPIEMQNFMLELMDKGELIFVRGNHEDLMVKMIVDNQGKPLARDFHNGTYETALQLVGFDEKKSCEKREDFVKAVCDTPFMDKIIPFSVDYFETTNYIFVHGYIPCFESEDGELSYNKNWRNADWNMWYEARWLNGMKVNQTICEPNKTIVCGHFSTSYGHTEIEKKEVKGFFDIDYSPYYADGIIALDACTAESGIVNCIVIND